MARDSKLEVAAINIRIPEDRPRNYRALLTQLSELRQGVRVYGDSYLAISFFDPETGLGILSKYTELDLDGDWFDLEDFDTATPDKLEGISIPDNLRPNHASFYFQLNNELHVIAFARYSASRNLSSRAVGVYFSEVLNLPAIRKNFGLVESDIVKSYDAVDRILSLPKLKYLRLSISRPNSDDIGEDLAAIIERRLREQNARTYEEVLEAGGTQSLRPNERTAQLGRVAAENGGVFGKALIDGVLTDQNTQEQPLVEATTFKADDVPERSVFARLAEKIFGRIGQARAELR